MTSRLVVTDSGIKSSELSAKIYRRCECGCPNPEPHPQNIGLPTHWLNCPRCGLAARIEEVGVISSYHKNPIINWVRNFKIDYCKDGFWKGARAYLSKKYRSSLALRIVLHVIVALVAWFLAILVWGFGHYFYL